MSKNTLRSIILGGLFLVPFIPFLVSGSLFFPFITTKAFVWRIIVEIIFASWLLLAISDSEYRPKKSPLLYAVLAFIAVVGIADLFGVAPLRSLWSNYERMEGFVSMLHIGAYFVVILSFFKEADWKKWWNTSLIASALMVGYALLQVIGSIRPSQSDARVDGTFGNAIYLAVYLLFHIFIALYFCIKEWRNTTLRYLYGALILAQLFILYFTATRGSILGVLGGLFIFALLNLRNKDNKWLRKGSMAVLTLLIVVVGGFFLFRDSALVKESPVLSRFASINVSEIKTQGRYFIWPMALKGIAERPVLGWGQENFSNVFQKYYQPEMYILEPWFDRAHNVFLDWAIAGGLLGLLFYLSLYAIPLYLLYKAGSTFSSLERSTLTALISAYFFHNIFVFDHLVSYILFFSLVAYIQSRSGGELLWKNTWSEDKTRNLALPAVAVGLVLVFYFVNWKSIVANTSLISALQEVQSGRQSSAVLSLEKSYQGSILGRQETVEQIAVNSANILMSNISVEEKNKFFAFAKEALTKQAVESNTDTRAQISAGTFLSLTGSPQEALVYLERARELAPQKQQVLFELGSAYFNNNEPAKGLAIFKEVYELSPNYKEAKVVYLMGAIYAGDLALEARLLRELQQSDFLFDNRVLSAYAQKKRIAEAMEIIVTRIKLDPQNKTTYEQLIKEVQNLK